MFLLSQLFQTVDKSTLGLKSQRLDARRRLAQCLTRLLGFALPDALVANVSDSYYEKSDPKHGSNHHLMLPEVAAEHPDLYRLLTARTKARLPAELLAALRVNTS